MTPIVVTPMANIAWAADAFRKHGLQVIEHDGWKSRGRPYTFEPHAVIFHHTASSRAGGPAPAIGTVTFGRPGIPGPLCQILVDRLGRVHMIAAGYANHGGYGGPWGDIPADSANRYSVGIEVENDGVGEPWSPQVKETVAKTSAILLHRFNRAPFYCFGHKEWTPRKIDPNGIHMPAFRKGPVRKYSKALKKGKNLKNL